MKSRIFILILLLGAIITFILALHSVVLEYQGLRQSGVLEPPEQRFRPLLHPTSSPDTYQSRLAEVDEIAEWMTFDYINKSFGLPTSFLSTSLIIGDIRYPNLTVRHYARENQIDPLTVVAKVQAAVRQYITDHRQ